MSGFRFKDEGRDVLGEVCGQYAPQSPPRLLAGQFETVEALAAGYLELEQASAELDSKIRNANLNEIFWGGS